MKEQQEVKLVFTLGIGPAGVTFYPHALSHAKEVDAGKSDYFQALAVEFHYGYPVIVGGSMELSSDECVRVWLAPGKYFDFPKGERLTWSSDQKYNQAFCTLLGYIKQVATPEEWETLVVWVRQKPNDFWLAEIGATPISAPLAKAALSGLKLITELSMLGVRVKPQDEDQKVYFWQIDSAERFTERFSAECTFDGSDDWCQWFQSFDQPLKVGRWKVFVLWKVWRDFRLHEERVDVVLCHGL